MLWKTLPILVLFASGCAPAYGGSAAGWSHPSEVGGMSAGGEAIDHQHHDDDDAVSFSPEQISAASNVLILQTTQLNRPAEVIGVVDAHAEMGGENAALGVLRARAAAMGANAVVGVAFHHGEGHGEPTHLSGMAVRFVTLGL